MSRSIPRMAWRLCTSSSLAQLYCTPNGSPACNNAPPMNPTRRNAAAMEPMCNNAPARRPPATRTRNVPARATCPPSRVTHAARRPSTRATRPPVARTRHARRRSPARATHAAGRPHAARTPHAQKKRRHPQGVAAPRSVTQTSVRTGRGSRARTARPRRRPRTEQCPARAGRTSSCCQPCS